MKNLKSLGSWFFAVFFFYAGLMHFVQEESFTAIVPPFIPFPKLIVWTTGLMELVFAILLILPRYRKLAGFLLAPFLLAVLPANIHMAMNNIPFGEMSATPTTLWLRVALQFPLILSILWVTGNISRSFISN
ncbi:MAG: DoxX family membrane protein [Hellea sp.]|jgi:uncharacterized membrane protein|nr:DoxX family membrane protein [Hellea sp.]MBT7398482.1 DoxX family membrane protein [Hellea sp.]MDG1126153.1 DoxX family membrane protein [Hellea sp.]